MVALERVIHRSAGNVVDDAELNNARDTIRLLEAAQRVADSNVKACADAVVALERDLRQAQAVISSGKFDDTNAKELNDAVAVRDSVRRGLIDKSKLLADALAKIDAAMMTSSARATSSSSSSSSRCRVWRAPWAHASPG